jgi:hypothetical protein
LGIVKEVVVVAGVEEVKVKVVVDWVWNGIMVVGLQS